ncbi:type VI secretion system lipoprotein TssJ [Paraburkholderia tagetis]|uniref:Type VI secretion system lipoprotein TssJ n=1 Tax=Paraburkholderia tagetis TaxID=2913261 RepID=A0A9X1UKU6_9BURK|nr:type VI secretion system lipoprotein TssJ [Paraburkholderia tagetis]MCG5075971.1 type VI secretion system lipoprotein TssJ [Paraburkholderia tagetis]
MSRRRAAVVALAVAPILLLAGCGAWQAVSDGTSNALRAVFYRQVKVLNVDLAARDALNPDDAGRSTSVAVRVYQLKDRKVFDGASYDDLMKSDKTVLAQDLNSSMAAVLNPGASASFTEPLQKSTQYVAVIALYRVPGTDSAWKRVIEKKKLDPEKPLKLELVANQLQIAGDAGGQTATR